MSLEPEFVLPDPIVSKEETRKRNELITWFSEVVDDAIVGFIVSGSMGNGYDYSVKETSDVDMQLIVTSESVTKLKDVGIFDTAELEKAIAGYIEGFYEQFSLVFQKDGVSMECHFWDQSAFIAAITYQSSNTKRLRSGIDAPSTDHGYSFNRAESVKDYYGEMINNYAVGTFPSYREENGVIYLCRPITNILGLPRVGKTNEELNIAIEKTWDESIGRLASIVENGVVNLSECNIENTLPGKNKVRPGVLALIREKTKEKLTKTNIPFTD